MNHVPAGDMAVGQDAQMRGHLAPGRACRHGVGARP